MATNPVRLQAIIGGVINGTATAAQMDRVGLAFSRRAMEGLLVDVEDYAALTQAQRADLTVKRISNLIIGVVRDTEAAAAEAAARAAAHAAVNQEFPSEP